MSQSRRITSYFKRPKFALSAPETRSDSPLEDPAPSSPLTDLSQILPSDVTFPDTPDGPSSQLKRSLLLSAEDPADNDPTPQTSFQRAETEPSHKSQRIIKNGKEVVISSDGDESDSAESLVSPEDLLLRFTTPKPPKVQVDGDSGKEYEATPGRNLRSVKALNHRSAPQASRAYKNSLDSLVVAAVTDSETEAGISRLKAEMKAESAKQSRTDTDKGGNLHEGMLASALDDGTDDTTGLQRLLDAVRRTEAFDLAKSWSFFDLQAPLPPPPDFPRDCVCPGTYLAVLREPGSRERAFYSGIIDFALSRELLPDELVRWIFYSIPSESRDSLRYAYCRAIKHMSADRLRSLIQPEDIDMLFWQMNARPEALVSTEPLSPDPHPQSDFPQSRFQHHTALISVLDIFRDVADLFADDTRKRLLSILLRLPLDASLTRNPILSAEIERTITAMLEGVTGVTADDIGTSVCKIAYTTLKDAELQSRALEHVVPTNYWIATLRRRLAYIFLTSDPSADVGSQDKSEVTRIINLLKDPRFDVKRYKKKGQPEYDYGELRAIATLLEIIIDSGWSEAKFPDESTEEEFNRAVDILADRVKKIFTAIEDSGASHLKRTLAKEALESLHYRILYSVRTRPPPKKVFFGQHASEKKNQNLLKYVQKVAIRNEKPGS
ncbi:hypothetical protein BJX61DRAFT_240368 [Aspergillus egyptiacus]|nr:hypothetical protein BJX61DRAFT_240368 [Aspergillus egyptiacus]